MKNTVLSLFKAMK